MVMLPDVKDKTEESVRETGNKAPVFPRYEGYSIKRSISEAWRLFSEKPIRYVMKLLPALLLAGIGAVCAAGAVCHLMADHLVPACVYADAGVPRDLSWAQFKPSTAAWVAYGAVFVVGIAVCWCVKCWVWTLAVCEKKQVKAVFSDKKYLNTLFHTAGRLFVYDIFQYLPLLVVGGGVIAVSSVWSLWWLLAFLPFYVVITIVSAPGRTARILQEVPLRQALRRSLNIGFRDFGGLLIVNLLTAIPVLAAVCALLLPLVVYPLAVSANAVNPLIGSVSGMPLAVTVCFAIAGVVVFAFVAFLFSLRIWPVMFKTWSKSAKHHNS